jgi:hypothetical protein
MGRAVWSRGPRKPKQKKSRVVLYNCKGHARAIPSASS